MTQTNDTDTSSENKTEEETTENESLTNAFELVQHSDEIQDAINDDDVFVGRRESGMITDIGLMGGHGYTDNPENVTFGEKAHYGRNLAKKLYRGIANFDLEPEFTFKFPSKIDHKTHTKSSLEYPYSVYTFEVYMRPDEYMSTEEFNTELTEFLMDNGNLPSDFLRGVGIDYAQHTIGEQFKSVFPWVKHYTANIQEIDERGKKSCPEDVVYELPEPLADMKNDLHKLPQLPDYYVVTITIYEYNRHQRTYNRVVDSFGMEDFGNEQHQFLLEKGTEDKYGEHLSSLETSEHSETISYRLDVNVPNTSVEELKEQHDMIPRNVSTKEEYAQWVGKIHFRTHYNKHQTVNTGVVNVTEHDSHTTIKTIVKTLQ